MNDKEKELLYGQLKAEMYYLNLTEIPGRGFCAVHKYIFTTGLLYGLDQFGLQGRYCFKTTAEAIEALKIWDGKTDPPGNWIKHKGRTGEWSNPNYNPDVPKEKSKRLAYLIAGYLKNTLTDQDQDELDEWIGASDSNMKLFEDLTDKGSVEKALEILRKDP